IESTVNVEHPSHALVYVLRSETEHVVVEPVGGHGFMPVARDLVDPASIVGIRIDGVPSRKHNRIVIVIELTGEEISAGEAVILCAVVPVMFVSADGNPPEAAVLGEIGGQLVAETEKDCVTAITRLHQLGGKCSLVSPQG